MGDITIRMQYNLETGKKDISIDLVSESDALPIEHERDHRAIVEGLLGKEAQVAAKRAGVDGPGDPVRLQHGGQERRATVPAPVERRLPDPRLARDRLEGQRRPASLPVEPARRVEDTGLEPGVARRAGSTGREAGRR